MHLIDVHHISRSFGSNQALRDVTLSLEPGSIGLVGNNGAGKSTLLKILLGILAPDAGTGTILGVDIRHASHEMRGRIGYMPEAAALVPVLKGVEFVTLAGDLYGMSHRDARRRAHEVLNYVGLGELRYRRLEEYSAGNLQRLKLAAALVHDPQLLLLDEPTNGLDPAGRQSMLRLVDDLIAETGKSLILCTHLLGDVERLCDTVVVLHRGSVVRSGSVEALRQSAGNRFELSWQEPGGTSNFLPALQSAGVQLAEGATPAKAAVTVPEGFRTSKFFELAHATGAVLVRLKPEEEDLATIFFRVTDEATAHTASSKEPAHGN